MMPLFQAAAVATFCLPATYQRGLSGANRHLAPERERCRSLSRHALPAWHGCPGQARWCAPALQPDAADMLQPAWPAQTAQTQTLEGSLLFF